MSGRCREAVPNFRQWFRGPPGCPGVVGKPSRKFGRPSRISGSVRKALPDVRKMLSNARECSRGPPRCPGVVGKPSRMCRSVRKDLLDVQEAILDVRVFWRPSGCP